MKKFYLFAAFALLVSVSINGMNQFSVSPNDTVRIHPNRLGGYTQMVFSMSTDAFCDSWDINMAYPKGTMVKLVNGITPLSGMCVDYCNAQGQWLVYEPQLQVSAQYYMISATTSDMWGYYDYTGNGVYIPYGSVKWMPGTRDMFSLNFYIEDTFRTGELEMDVTFNSSTDSRGAILSNVRSFKRTHIWVGYERGDINGDGIINITDVTLLIAALERDGGAAYLDEWSTAAADVNGDGEVNITDATRLIARVINA